MIVITVGRGSGNDVVINDPLVSRTHCQIVQDDSGRFKLVDLNSRNGTFVNGTRQYGPTSLNKTDIIRIGNTTLPWLSYFPSIPGPGPGTGPGPGPGTGHSTGTGHGTGHGTKTSDAYSILTLLSGLVSLGIIVYLVIDYFTSFQSQLFEMLGASSFQGLAIYLRGMFGIGGQWFWIIAAIVFGGLADLFDSLGESEGDTAKSIGLVLGNIGLTVGVGFLLMAIFAEKIVS